MANWLAVDSTTENKVIRPIPIVSATVVVAVRAGLRRAPVVARRIRTPNSRDGSQPRTAASGPATSGPAARKPRKKTVPPAATRNTPVLVAGMPLAVRASPAAPSRTATVTRVFRPRTVPSGGAVSAATGAVRDAAIAGSSAAPTVTAVPVARDTATDAAVSATLPEFTAAASAAPRPSPATLAARPSTSDSVSMSAMTWRRVAPTQRSSATSRSRWASRMRKVL